MKTKTLEKVASKATVSESALKPVRKYLLTIMKNICENMLLCDSQSRSQIL